MPSAAQQHVPPGRDAGARALLGLAAGLVGISLVCELCWLLFAERVLHAAAEGRSIGILNRWGAAHGKADFAFAVGDLHGDLHSLELLGFALWVLVLLGWLVLRVWRKPFWLPLVLLGWWLALELLIAPLLNFQTWTVHYRAVHDVDHRPTRTGGQWNSDSLVATPESFEFQQADLNLVFLGDSFTMGFKLPDFTQAFPSLVGAELAGTHPDARLHVANFGWVSSSPLLSYRRLVDIGERYAPDVVVLNVDMGDFFDELRYQRLLEKRGVFWLYDKLPLTLHFLQELAPETYRKVATSSVGGIPAQRFFATEAPLELTREWLQPLVENVGRIDEWCRAHGADFVLVILPRGYQYSARESPSNWERDEYRIQGPFCLEPFRFFDELRPKVAYPIVSLLPDFQRTMVFPTCLEDDPHWNAAGHRVAAEAIARALEPIVRRRLGR